MKYRTVQIPEDLIQIVKSLLPVLAYRTHHELIIEALRIRIEKLIELQDNIEKAKNMQSESQKKI